MPSPNKKKEEKQKGREKEKEKENWVETSTDYDPSYKKLLCKTSPLTKPRWADNVQLQSKKVL